jgi:hypothetical protein
MQIYYLSFLFLSSVVLINIFLAILVEAFSVVKESASNSETLIEGLSEVAMHDASSLASKIPLMCRVTSKATSRFMSDSKLRTLLDAWQPDGNMHDSW